MTIEEIKNYVIEHKECCKKLAEEYRQRYNEDNTNKLALNMFYHNVIAYNNFETILATIEDRNSMIMCFSEPPILSEKTVEVELNRIEELEVQNNWLEGCKLELGEHLGKANDRIAELEQQIEKMKRHSNCKYRSEYNEFDPYSKVCQSCCNLEKWEFGN